MIEGNLPSPQGHQHHPEPLEKPSTQRRLAAIIAIIMVLPALGMIVGGLAYGRVYLWGAGLGVMFGLGIGYFIILRGVLKRFEESSHRI